MRAPHDVSTSLRSRGLPIAAYLLVYLTCGLYTQIRLLDRLPLPRRLIMDFAVYERALMDALNGSSAYAIRDLGQGFLYPPPALLLIEVFAWIEPLALKIAIYSAVNIAIMALITAGVANIYQLEIQRTWPWFILCLGFAPFLELLHIGQINTFTLFGLFLMFLWETKHPMLSGAALSVAIATKVTPLVLLGYLAANRRRSILLATAAFLGGTMLLAAARYGLAPLVEFPSLFGWLIQQSPLDTNTQSFVAKMAGLLNSSAFERLTTHMPAPLQSPAVTARAWMLANPRSLQFLLSTYIALAILTSAVLTYVRRQPREPLFIVTVIGATVAPNVVWYHHFVFLLLPILVWMGWSRLHPRVVAWCLGALLVVQLDRWLPPYGLLIHVVSHVSILSLLVWQFRHYGEGVAGGSNMSLASPEDAGRDEENQP